MGRLSIVQQTARAVLRGANVLNAIVNPGGGANRSARVGNSPGEDSVPLPGDTAIEVDLEQIRGSAAVGFVDTKNAGVAGAGEVRRYARNAAGSPVAVFWLKADGTIVVMNFAGSIVMAPSGSVVINGVTIDPNGNIDAPGDMSAGGEVSAPTVAADTSLTVASKELNGHVHGGVSAGGDNTAPF